MNPKKRKKEADEDTNSHRRTRGFRVREKKKTTLNKGEGHR